MHLIVYTSETDLTGNDVNNVLKDISKKAKINNKKLNITGLLFYHNQRFVQVIEGEKDDLENLLSTIEKDDRHKNIQRIVDEETKKQGFNEWNMDSFNLSEKDSIDSDELINIGNAVKKVFTLDSAILTSFYKTLLSTHELKSK